MAVIYDYSTITPQQLQEDIQLLLTRLNQNLVSEFILVENKCEEALTSTLATNIAKSHEKMRVVVVEADEVVSTGRARMPAIDRSKAPFLLFLSAGNMPDSTGFLGE